MLGSAQAVWLDAGTIVWPGTDSGHSYKLYYSSSGSLAAGASDISGSDDSGGVALATGALTPAQQAAYPQYAGAVALTVPAGTAAQAGALLRDQLAVVQYSGSTPTNGTQVQIGPVLDTLYGASAGGVALGVTFDAMSDTPTFRLWAPTASAVQLNVYANAATQSPVSVSMTENPASGVWSYTAADASWTNTAYYTYSVRVFSRAAASSAGYGAVATNTVSDPYAVTLNGDSTRAMVVNLADGAGTPAGWPGALPATSATPTDAVIYELHVRDFSVNDPTVPAAHQGRFLAFTDSTSNGMKHLAALAGAGLTHVHLLPATDFASIDALTCVNPGIPATTGNGTAAELAVIATQHGDCYNWGYDPFHYGAPQASYASDPTNGLTRVLEFRQMVQALHRIGLRLVLDVVYNHTSASGQDPHSVLDQIVPGYYHRLDGSGAVESYSCCADTATERTMMAKLMTDTLVRWADQYKVDGFRFDIMGMIPKAAMIQALSAVNAVAGADGRGHTYFYGEGWTPNAAVSAVITPAMQTNMAGTGIGTFNDRLRDGVRGGSPSDSGSALTAHQGFINGLCYNLNPSDTADCSGDAADALFTLQDRISVGLAGNLASFPLRAGVSGAQVDYFGSPTGYTQQPQENLVYAACHDNETLFDISQYKHPASVTVADAGRAQVVALSLVLLAEGVAFVHGADDLLRSKSGDGNSFDSGDYFNRIYWDGSANNNWSVGLPPQNTGNNAANAATLGPLLSSRPVPDAATIAAVAARFQEFLGVRRATDLFRLASGADINNCVSFPDQGRQVHGLIVEQIQGVGCVAATSSGYDSVLVLYNANSSAQSFSLPSFAGVAKGTGSGQVSLHPVQQAGSDSTLLTGWNFTSSATSGTFTVPARTTAVFVRYH
ncbi:MAG TPA: alpha-1,6-glucosidase domain-containing protein [Steroidobacteraceae bacterium]|nr:alpha-1,6-glucosidase domain-containing protein [Steroidobacteraceae bacterium]